VGPTPPGPRPTSWRPYSGWSEETIKREVETYLARVEAERASQEQTEDVAADAARLLAPELRRTRDTHHLQ
jgi:hypothetical protein